MGVSTWTGPIRAGNIPNTSGTTVGQDVANVGYAELTQAQAITQSGTATALATNIVIPAYSLILDIDVYATAGWSGSATLSVGTSATSNELVSAATGPQTVGTALLTPGTDATRTGRWINVGANDVRIYVLSSATGTGAGTIVVNYVQAINAP